MIRIIIIILLLLGTMAATPMLIGDKGYILIAMGNITIESTVVSAIFMLIAALIALTLIIKLLRSGVGVGLRGWQNVVFVNRNRAKKRFSQGVVAFLLEDYAKAEQLLSDCADASEQSTLAWLMAAEAARKQNLANNSQHYLEQINQQGSTASTELAVIIFTAKQYLSAQNYTQARQLLDSHHKLIGHDTRLLALEIELCLKEHRFTVAIEYLVNANKQKSFTKLQLESFQRQAYYGLFQQTIQRQSSEALHQIWQALPRKLKQQEAIIFAYSQVLAEQHLTEPLVVLLLPIIKQDASDAFLEQVIRLPISKPDALLTEVQKHLKQDPLNSKWLRVLAHLAYAGQQWSMAEKSFVALINQASATPQTVKLSAIDVQHYATLLTQQGQAEKAANLLLKKLF